jgi:hypothetical protein
MRAKSGFWGAVWIAGALVGSLSCTAPVERRQAFVEVVIDADRIVRANTVRVEAEVEVEATPGAGWMNKAQRRFRPAPDEIKWPNEFKVDVPSQGRVPGYSLVAIAFDKQGAVVARAQAIREAKTALEEGLKVHFEASCFRQTTLCNDGETCSEGACVNARNAQPLEPGDDRVGMATQGNTATTDEPVPEAGLAAEGEACSGDARACPANGAQRTLRCDGSVWRADVTCADEERCDTVKGANQGTCRPVARECMNQKPNVAFCVEDTMRVCLDLVTSEVRPCAENQRCVPGASEAQCGCSPGFVMDGLGCRAATDCGEDNGGCDKLTRCSLVAGERTCTACPDGYSGSGVEGCAPLLQTLIADHATVTPALAPEVFAYRIQGSLVTPTVSLTAAGPGATTHVAFDGVEVQQGQPWFSPRLSSDETRVELKLTSEAGVSSTYVLTIDRKPQQSAFIKPSNTGQDDQFASAVAVSGDTLAAGAPFEDSSGIGVNGNQSNNAASDSGAVYVYRRGEKGWAQEAYLKAPVSEPGERFGCNLTLEGDTLAVGAIHADFSEAPNPSAPSGSVYVFTRANGAWSQTQKLMPSNPAGGNLFGLSLKLQGDTLAIGAMGDAAESGEHSGVVYIFERVGGSWVERQKLAPSEPRGVSGIGGHLVLAGDRLLAGAPYGAGRRGAAFVFARKNGTWAEEQKLAPDTLVDDATFGWSGAMQGDRIVVGTPHWPTDVLVSAPPGEAYVFERQAGRWQQTAMLRAPSPGNTDSFGASAVMTATSLVIAADRENGNSRGLNGDPTEKGAVSSGAVFVYLKVGKEWVLSDYVKAHNASAADGFGWHMGLSGETLVVAAPYQSSDGTGVDSPGGGVSSRSGALYVFR